MPSMPSKWFNTAGPCKADIHYMLPPLARLPQLERLIAQQGYFVIHAPRQTGKTTAMLALAKQLTDSGQYAAIMVSAEAGSAFSQSSSEAEETLLALWKDVATYRLPAELHPPEWENLVQGQRVHAAFQAWAVSSPRPLVIFIDEIDSLRDELLVSILRQLRSGYPNRPDGFPHALALVGVRDVRDYKVASGGSERLNTSSPFNVKVESLTLRDFTIEEVTWLYRQHTEETGQVFSTEAIARAYELTRGQPWLVNAIARQLVEFLVTDIEQTISAADVDAAKEILIQRQDTHLDSLASILREDRVRKILEPMLLGQEIGSVSPEDIQYLVDLGLCRRSPYGGIEVSNPIYQEVIPRSLSQVPQDALPQIYPTWLTEEGELDTQQLLDAFLAFWRQHGEPLLKSAPYHEIAPHLVLMAFLHRVVNGGGSIEREYAIGRDRMDLCVRYGHATLAIEIKVWRDGRKDPLSAGLEQLDRYLNGLGLEEGWLVIFDRRADLPPIAERTSVETSTTPQGKNVTVIRG